MKFRESLSGHLQICTGHRSTARENRRSPPDRTYLVNVNLRFCRRFQESTVIKRSGQVGSLVFVYNTLLFQIALIAHENHRHVVRVFHTQNLLSQIDDLIIRIH